MLKIINERFDEDGKNDTIVVKEVFKNLKNDYTIYQTQDKWDKIDFYNDKCIIECKNRKKHYDVEVMQLNKLQFLIQISKVRKIYYIARSPICTKIFDLTNLKNT
jgi:hypothetical protein